MAVKVGVGVIIANPQGQVLLGKRCGSHAPFWSIPGGHVEEGETFEQAAIREVEEETGLIVTEPRLIGVTNNLATWLDEGVHSVSMIMVATYVRGEPQLREPEKCEQWRWCNPQRMPEPCFEACCNGIHLWLNGEFYLPSAANNA